LVGSIFDGAIEEHSSFALTNDDGDEVIVGAEASGIDFVAAVIAHELYHKYLYETYNDTNLHPDDDGDGIPDSQEPTLDGISTELDNPDTYSMGDILERYSEIGDNEIRCRIKEMNPGITTYPLKDWSSPGKQW